MKTKILTDFQICISVPLTLKQDFIKIFCQYKKKINIDERENIFLS